MQDVERAAADVVELSTADVERITKSIDRSVERDADNMPQTSPSAPTLEPKSAVETPYVTLADFPAKVSTVPATPPPSPTTTATCRVPKYVTVDELLTAVGLTWRRITLLALASLAYFAYCSELLVVVLTQQKLMAHWNLTPTQFSWVAFWPNLIGLVSSPVLGVVVDIFGRRFLFIYCSIAAGIFGMVAAAAPSFSIFIFLRVLTGIANGGLSASDYVYAMEIAPSNQRGRYPTVVTTMGALGVIYVAGLAWGLLDIIGWRMLMILAAIPYFICGAFRFCLAVETPQYLVAQGRTSEAWEACRKLRGGDLERALGHPIIGYQLVLHEGDVVPDCSENLDEDVVGPSQPRRWGWRLKDIGPMAARNVKEGFKRTHIVLKNKEYRRNMMVLGSLWALQSTGYWGATSFLPVYFSSLSLPPLALFFISIAAEIPSLAISFFFIDRKGLFGGRRTNLRGFSGIEAVVLALMAISLQFDTVAWHRFTAFLGAMIYFGITPLWNTLRVATQEAFETRVRATATTFCVNLSSIPSVVVFFVGAAAVDARQLWVYPTVWACVYGVFFIVSMTLLSPDKTDETLR